MLLVDEIVSQTEDAIVCRKRFRSEEYFFQGHYPGQPLVPGVILCEATIQAGAILLSHKLAHRAGVPMLTRMKDVKFRRPVQPGQTAELSVQFKERLGDAFFLAGVARVDGQVALRLEFACTVAEPLALV